MPTKAKHTQATSEICVDEHKLIRACEALEMARVFVTDMGCLFDAIRDLSDEHSHAYRLAGIGTLLANDWANVIDRESEEADQMRTDLPREMLEEPPRRS